MLSARGSARAPKTIESECGRSRGPGNSEYCKKLLRSNPCAAAGRESPLTPRTPRERVQRHERRGVRAIILPSRISGIARKVPPAPAMMVTHCAYSLKILERSRFGLRHLLSVEVKRRHPAQQKIGRVGTKIRKPAKLGRGHADIFSHALHFLLPTAFQFQSGRASSGPLSPPLRNSLGQAFLSNGQGEHLTLLLLQPMVCRWPI